MNAIRIRRLNDLDDAELAALLDRRPQSDPAVVQTCREVINAVRTGGDDAVLEFTRAFDGLRLCAGTMRVPAAEFDDAEQSVSPAVTAAVKHAIRNIERFHRLQRCFDDRWLEIEPGVWCGERWSPFDTVCLYVPRGRGTFVSVACMLGVPARLAEVKRVIVCTPPGRNGVVDPATLFVCRTLEIQEVYRIGGAQAVAAVAYGTKTVPRCDKIVGPGNVYVSAARHLLSNVLDPGSPAGPSESLILCDDSTDPRKVAWNLLIEAEHGENSTAVLVTHSSRMAEAVSSLLPNLIEELTPLRRDYVRRVLSKCGGIILTSHLEESIAFANRFAAEHVALMVADPWAVHPRVLHAGEIVFGDYPLVSLANYAMGMNAVLPTGGSARWASALSLRDFQKVTSLGFCTREGYERLRPVVCALSRNEGFSAHHLAVENWRNMNNEKGTEA